MDIERKNKNRTACKSKILYKMFWKKQCKQTKQKMGIVTSKASNA